MTIPGRLFRGTGCGFNTVVHGVVWIAFASSVTVATAWAQPEDAGGEWKEVENSAKLSAYRLALRDGSFDAASKAFLTGTALPQLASRRNLPSIDRVRRRMREFLCGDVASEPQALDMALQTIVQFLAAAARDGKLDPAVRVNAALFMGEIRGPARDGSKDGKPWPGATAPLAAVVGDASLPSAVRIAAAQGLARHVEAAGPAVVAAVGPVLGPLLAPPAGDRVAADWLAARALMMLADLGPSAPPPLAQAAFGILADASRPATLRCRAAAALAALGPKAAGIDWSQAVTACRATAVAALQAEQARGRRARDLALIGGAAGGQPGQPGFDAGAFAAAANDPAAASLACRRAAWVLATLADALSGGDGKGAGKGGMAAIGGGHQQAALELAKRFRDAAVIIDEAADEASIIEAAGMLTGDGPAAAATGPAAAAPAAASAPAAAEEPAFNPFAR
jgi:hypothetical protein